MQNLQYVDDAIFTSNSVLDGFSAFTRNRHMLAWASALGWLGPRCIPRGNSVERIVGGAVPLRNAIARISEYLNRLLDVLGSEAVQGETAVLLGPLLLRNRHDVCLANKQIAGDRTNVGLSNSVRLLARCLGWSR